MPDRIHSYFSFDGEAGLPEEGVANFRGQPHYFWLRECCTEQCSGMFDLAPIDSELFGWVQELEGIWREWDLAYHAGKVELATHPARAGNNLRYTELSTQISQRAQALRGATTAIGVVAKSTEYLTRMHPFSGARWPAPGTHSAELEVTWHEAP